ncbi:IclR family transcriptional regulator [Ahrensia kielensis]|uniref:IclR family transcriptional regulator n=1 Tax=Ahrensia kielensis TaxID=76980 RepID=A0ABU9T6R6_9HYPH
MERAFSIINYLHKSKQAQRPIDIALGMNAPKSSIYELIGILTSLGVLERVDVEGRVFLGRKLHFWGKTYLESFDLARLAQPLLERITERTRETSQLCMLDGDKYTVVLMNLGSRQFRISADVGERTPIPWTASGRLLLGHMTEETIFSLIPEGDFILPDGSELAKQDFYASVQAAKDEGFFSFDSLADNYTHCFAAPVFDGDNKCVATICMIAPKADAKENYQAYRNELLASASELSDQLRGEVPPAI